MTKHLIVAALSLSLLLTASLYIYAGEKVVDSSEITISPITGDRMYRGAPFTGIAISSYPNGVKSKEEPFQHGRRHGTLKLWFETGQLAFESYYEQGRREGRTTSWWLDGPARSQADYINDLANGFSWEWYRSGETFKKFQYRDGQPYGLQQGWRENGKLFSNYEFRNGRTYGLRKSKLCYTVEDDEKIALN